MFDCCQIYDELDLLEIRLHTLYDTVEKFVVVESNKTHSGKLKELNFLLNRERFRSFLHKIIYIPYNGLSDTYPNFNPWLNENSQRDTILECTWHNFPKDGLLFISDVDEIAKPEKLLEAARISLERNTPVSIQMYNCSYYMNMVCESQPYWGPYIYNPSFHESPTTLRWHVSSLDYKYDFPTVTDGGWHFSNLGGVEKLKQKISVYAHNREFNIPEVNSEENLQACIENGLLFHEKVCHFYKEIPVYKKKEDLSYLPKYILDNIDRYKTYIG